MNNHSKTTRYQRKKDLLSSRMDEETVMMHPESGKYFSLNPVATRIWELLETPKTIDDLMKFLLDEFEAKPEVCENETKEFIRVLLEKEMLDVIQ